MQITSDGTKAIVVYVDNRGHIILGEIIDLKTRQTILERYIANMHINADGTKAIVISNDHVGEIIDLKTEDTIFERDKVKNMEVTSDGTKALVTYNDDGRRELVDLADYDRGINFATLEKHQLFFVFNLSHDPDLSNIQDMDKAKRIWQSFKPEVQQILKEEYFSGVDFSLLV